jgi:glycine hydroxymethyltransferase
MFRQGLLVNRLNGLPGMEGSAFRLSLAEVTRLGADEADAAALAQVFAALLTDRSGRADLTEEVARLRGRLSRPRYCYTTEQLETIGAPKELLEIFSVLERAVGAA